MRLTWLAIVSAAFLALSFEAHGEDWPMWRGPRGDRIGLGDELPTTWSTTENVL